MTTKTAHMEYPRLHIPVHGRISIRVKPQKGIGAKLARLLGSDERKANVKWIRADLAFEAPRALMGKAVYVLTYRYKKVHVFWDFKTTMICTSSCKNARRSYCVCSCKGKKHQQGLGAATSWHSVGDIEIEHGISQTHFVVYPHDLKNFDFENFR